MNLPPPLSQQHLNSSFTTGLRVATVALSLGIVALNTSIASDPHAKKEDPHAAPAPATSAGSTDKAAPASAHHGPPTVDPTFALGELVKGNERFIKHQLEHPNQSEARILKVASGQNPIAIIVCCSDSRVPPEIIFDQGLGDLFIIRIAGQVLNDPALGSIEYAVDHLGARLIMVLGHERCGAVTAAKGGGEVPGHIGSLVKAIRPAVERSKDEPGDALANAVQANVKLQVEAIKKCDPIISKYVQKKEVRVVGAYYDLDTGVVSNID